MRPRESWVQIYQNNLDNLLLKISLQLQHHSKIFSIKWFSSDLGDNATYVAWHNQYRIATLVSIVVVFFMQFSLIFLFFYFINFASTNMWKKQSYQRIWLKQPEYSSLRLQKCSYGVLNNLKTAFWTTILNLKSIFEFKLCYKHFHSAKLLYSAYQWFIVIYFLLSMSFKYSFKGSWVRNIKMLT